MVEKNVESSNFGFIAAKIYTSIYSMYIALKWLYIQWIYDDDDEVE